MSEGQRDGAGAGTYDSKVTDPTPARRVSLWIAIGALAVLVAGLAVWLNHSRPFGRLPEPAPFIEPGDEVVEQALGQIPGFVDSVAIKSRWMDVVAGADVSDLGPEKLEIFLRAANTQRCTCGCGYTLAACRTFDTTCPVSLPIVESLLDSVRTGQVASAGGLRERPLGP